MPSPPKLEKKTARARVNTANLKRLGLNNANGEPGLENTAVLVNATTGYNFNRTRQVKPKPPATRFNPFNRNAMARAVATAAPFNWNGFTRKKNKNKNKNKKNGNK